MNRTLFVEEFKKASKELDKRRLKKIIRESLNSSKDKDPVGKYALLITQEEMAELIQEISKILRGRNNSIGILEEMADVIISIEYVKDICGVSTYDLNKAINVKLDRLDRVLKEDKTFW